MPNSQLSTFDRVTIKAHEEWLFSEAAEMVNIPGLGTENLGTWQGSVYGAFGLETTRERRQSDWGLSALGEHNEPSLPSIIIQSCWSHEYNAMFEEMEEWMKRSNGVLQVAILLMWSIDFSDTRNPVLEGEFQVYTCAPKEQRMYQGPVVHEKVRSDGPEDRELPFFKITTHTLFGPDSRGRGASFGLSLTDLWVTALNIFDEDVESCLGPQVNEITGTGDKGREEPGQHHTYDDNMYVLLEQNQTTSETESVDFSDTDQSVIKLGAESRMLHNLAVLKVVKSSADEPSDTREGSGDNTYDGDTVNEHSEPHTPEIPTLAKPDYMDQTLHQPNEVIDERTATAVDQARREEDIFTKHFHPVPPHHSSEERTTHSPFAHLAQTSNATSDQNSIPQQTAGINTASTPEQCPHCLSGNCCNGTDSPLRNLPANFMSAGVLGPFSWCGFVVHIALSTLQPVAQDVLETSRDSLIRQVHEFTEARHREFFPESACPPVITADTKKTAIPTLEEYEALITEAENVVHTHSMDRTIYSGLENSTRGTNISYGQPGMGGGGSRVQSPITMRSSLGFGDTKEWNTTTPQLTHGDRSTGGAVTIVNAFEAETTDKWTQGGDMNTSNNNLGIDNQTGVQKADDKGSTTETTWTQGGDMNTSNNNLGIDKQTGAQTADDKGSTTETTMITTTVDTTSHVATSHFSPVNTVNNAEQLSEPEELEEENEGEGSTDEEEADDEQRETKFKKGSRFSRTFRGGSATSLAGSISSIGTKDEKGRRRRDKVIKVVTKAIETVGDAANNVSKMSRTRRYRNKKNTTTGTGADTLGDGVQFDPMQTSLPVSLEDHHTQEHRRDSGIDMTSIRSKPRPRRKANSNILSGVGAEPGEDSGSEYKDTDGEEFGEKHGFGTMENNSTSTTATTITKTTTTMSYPYRETTDNRETEDSQESGKNIYESSAGLESQETVLISGTGSNAAIIHQIGCKHSESTGPGLVQCDCAGTDLVSREKAQSPVTANPAALYAQLKAIMDQIYSQTGQLVVPKLNTSVTCERVETGKEEVLVEVDVRVTYRSSGALEHNQRCSQARQVLGTGGNCPIEVRS